MAISTWWSPRPRTGAQPPCVDVHRRVQARWFRVRGPLMGGPAGCAATPPNSFQTAAFGGNRWARRTFLRAMKNLQTTRHCARRPVGRRSRQGHRTGLTSPLTQRGLARHAVESRASASARRYARLARVEAARAGLQHRSGDARSQTVTAEECDGQGPSGELVNEVMYDCLQFHRRFGYARRLSSA